MTIQSILIIFFFQAEDGIRDKLVTGVQTCALPISLSIIVRTDPALRPGDQIFLMLDGQPLNGGVATGSQFTLTPVDRGTHTLQAVGRDSTRGLPGPTPGVAHHRRPPPLLGPAKPPPSLTPR